MKILKNNKPLNKKSRDEWQGWLFVSPFLIGFFGYFCSIMWSSLKFSFSDVSITENGYQLVWSGFENYKYALTVDPNFIKSTVNTIVSMLTTIPVILLFSLFVAVLLNQKMVGRTFFRAVFFLPVVVSTGLIAMADSGNAVLQNLSSMSAIDTGAQSTLISLENIESYISGLNFSPAMMEYITSAVNNIMGIVSQSGVQIIIFLAGLQSISPAIYESANIEGASGWEIFWKITFPLITPMLLVNLFFSIITNVTDSRNAIVSLINTIGFSKSMFGQAAAMSWLYLLVVLLLIVLVVLVMKRFVFYQGKER